jgi:hypothetical protein
VSVEEEGTAAGYAILLDAEDPATFLMENAAVNKLVYRLAAFEDGVKLDDRFGPKQPSLEIGFNDLVDPFIADGNEALCVSLVLICKTSTEIKNVHRSSSLLAGDRFYYVLGNIIAKLP